MSIRRAIITLSMVLVLTGLLAVFIADSHVANGNLIVQDLSFSSPHAKSIPTDFDIHFNIGTMVITTGGLSSSLTSTLSLTFIFGTVVIDQKSKQDSSLRERIIREIDTNPGIHLRELRRFVGCAMGALQYHLKNLEQDGVVVSLRNGNTKHFFLSTFSSDEQELRLTAMLRNPTIHAIVSACHRMGHVTQADLSRELSIDKSLISYYVNGLVKSGFLRTIRVFGREKPVTLTDWTQCVFCKMAL